MTQQELIQYIGNEDLANRLTKILGNPDLAKAAYDELEASKNAVSKEDPSAVTTHDNTVGVSDPPRWLFLYKGHEVTYKNGKTHIDKVEVPITFTEWVPFEAIIRAAADYIDNNLNKENMDKQMSLHDALTEMKEKLQDAPVEVKASFNNIVKHLDEKKGTEKKDSDKESEKKESEPKSEEGEKKEASKDESKNDSDKESTDKKDVEPKNPEATPKEK